MPLDAKERSIWRSTDVRHVLLKNAHMILYEVLPRLRCFKLSDRQLVDGWFKKAARTSNTRVEFVLVTSLSHVLESRLDRLEQFTVAINECEPKESQVLADLSKLLLGAPSSQEASGEVEQFKSMYKTLVDDGYGELLNNWLRGKEFTSKFEEEFDSPELLGKGAYGVVFRATRHLDKTAYAVKRIGLVNDENTKKQATKEVEIWPNLAHSGIVRYYYSWIEKPPPGWQQERDEEMKQEISDFTSTPAPMGASGDSQSEASQSAMAVSTDTNQSTTMTDIERIYLYIQMELCHKETLKDWLASNTDDRSSCVSEWFEQMVEAVKYLHDFPLIHRDLKPSNIYFSLTGNKIKIGDFGLVTVMRRSDERKGNKSQALGTSLYMAPETEECTPKVDIYSLGVILLELHVPFGTHMERYHVLASAKESPKHFDIQHVMPSRMSNFACIAMPLDAKERSIWRSTDVRHVLLKNAHMILYEVLPRLRCFKLSDRQLVDGWFKKAARTSNTRVEFVLVTSLSHVLESRLDRLEQFTVAINECEPKESQVLADLSKLLLGAPSSQEASGEVEQFKSMYKTLVDDGYGELLNNWLRGKEFTSKFEEEFDSPELLGKGAYGVVFRATRHLDKTAYAVKRIGLVNDENTKKQATKEVEIWPNLAHSGIVRYYYSWIEKPPPGWQQERDEEMKQEISDFTSTPAPMGASGDSQSEASQSAMAVSTDTNQSTTMTDIERIYLYIQMELCHKETLKDWLASNTDDRSSCVSEWFEQMVEAVKYLHDFPLIHRDLKPSNIYFSLTGNKIKIGDFGLVTVMRRSDERKGNKSQALGTSLYMAPETEECTPKVDIYSLGVILLELHVPFGTHMERYHVLASAKESPKHFDIQHVMPSRMMQLWRAMLDPNPKMRPNCHEIQRDEV